MQDKPSDEEIAGWIQRMKELLEEWLPKDPNIAAPKLEEAYQIRKTLEQMGWIVDWKAKVDPETLKCSIELSVFKPKEDMAPEEAARYDEWFLKRWNLKPPSKDEGLK